MWLLYSLPEPTSSWTVQNLQYVQDGCIDQELIWAACMPVLWRACVV